ncbi:30S ribosomal protein THX [Costertonia aggregata]|uniref:30S ribosomal protein THX n=1 Tax=Costertonia aggregata TaxID=343403 RepID=A0A7H9ALI4_9FLAO|nr:30S ribosomal protein THX [Costertonia aggregata]QLG44267.1 30S ribosomal protein THX [Costertonia aggregata]
MGKGDKKTRRGKIANKSYGARRPKGIKKKPSVEEKISIKNKK